MKTFLRKVGIRIIGGVVHALRMFWWSRGQVWILPAASPGSLGDDAMVCATIGHCRSLGYRDFVVVDWDDGGSWQQIALRFPDVKVSVFSFRLDHWSTLRFAKSLVGTIAFFSLGADVMDGYYNLRVVKHATWLPGVAALCGVPTTIVGFSFNTKPSDDALTCIARLPASVRFCVRDAVSHERFERVTGRKAELVADAAFLLQPLVYSEHIYESARWIKMQQQSGKIVIGLNLGPTWINEGLANERQVAAIFESALAQLKIEKLPVAVLLIPHDVRASQKDVFLCEVFQREHGAAFAGSLRWLAQPMVAAEVKFLAGLLDVAVTFRMHFAIACLGRGKAPLCITYQDKFEGLLRNFGISELALNPRQSADPAFLASRIADLIRHRQARDLRVNTALPGMTDLSRQNFALLEKKGGSNPEADNAS